MTAKIFTLLRHGQINGKPALYGHTDVELSEQGCNGLASAIANIHSQTPIANIISSPLIRCAAAAQLFATEHKIPLQLQPQLKEMHFGQWDGIAFDDLAEHWQQLEAFWQAPFLVAPPEGETLGDFAARIITAWDLLVQNNSGEHQLIICHGGVIRIILAHILQIDWRTGSLFKRLQIDYGSSTRIEIADHENAQAQVKWIGLS